MRRHLAAVWVATALATIQIVTAAPARADWSVTGIDVSKWQETIDWQAAADAGVDFAIIKATQDRVRVDPMFEANRAGASAAGITVGMYHVASPSAFTDDARAEADHFLDVAAPGAGDIIPALDIEISNVPLWMSPAQLESWCRAWLTRVRNRLGVRPMIYGSISLFTDNLGGSTWFADQGYRLWLARWGPLPDPLPANDWQGRGWTFWQWTNKGSMPGIEGDVDRDRFAGTDLRTASIARVQAATSGGGRLDSRDGRIACGSPDTCEALYDPGASVTFTATPRRGFELESWGGACASAGVAETCTVKTLGSRTVIATFADLDPATATILPPSARAKPLRVAFDESVRRVTIENVIIRTVTGRRIAASLRCLDRTRERVSCETGRARTAILRPVSPLRQGRSYVAVVDPASAAPILDRADNPTPRTALAFVV